MSDKRALLTRALATLARSHFDLTAREDVSVAHILTNKNLLFVFWLLVIETNKAELRAKDLREYLRNLLLFLSLSSLHIDIQIADPLLLCLSILLYPLVRCRRHQLIIINHCSCTALRLLLLLLYHFYPQRK